MSRESRRANAHATYSTPTEADATSGANATPPAGDYAVESPTSAHHASHADRIRLRAYHISLRQSNRPADPVGDWLQAERELGPAPRGIA